VNSPILITGALGGLGGAFVHECACRGYDIFLTDLIPDGEEYASHIASTFHIRARYQACDLTDPSSRLQLIASLEAAGTRFRGLINVAGMDREGAFLTRTRQELVYLNNLIIVASTDLTHAVLSLRDPSQRFMLINVCSLAAFFPMPYKVVYSSSKRYLLQFTLALGEEIREFGTATALCPGGLPTTPEIRRKNAAQGFFGKLTTMEPQCVARRTIDLALRGRRIYVPGFFNLVISGLGGLLPLPLVLRYIGKRWRAIQAKLARTTQ